MRPKILWVSLALVMAAVSLLDATAQSKPCGTGVPPPSKSWKIVPCEVAPEPSGVMQRAIRQARGAIFDDSTGRRRPEDLLEGPGRVGRGGSWSDIIALPPLPVTHADAVVVGKVVKFQPYFSNDRTAIYHELTIDIGEVFHDTTSRALGDGTVAVLGEGGSLRLPDGRVFTDFVPPEDENDIRVGGRYVLFLFYRPEGDSFGLLKAWELRGDRAFPMALSDIRKAQEGELPLSGATESVFLQAVRDAVSRSR